MLTDDLESLDVGKISTTIKNDGAIILPNFFSKETVNSFLSDFQNPSKENLNNNNSGIVYYNNQKFISQTLIHSKTTFDFLINDKVQDIFQKYLDTYTLKANRFYLTGGGGISLWHHDEKNSGYSSKGIILLVYFSDVLSLNNGPFQYIKKTHKISTELNDDYFWEENIQLNHKNDIITCLGEAGTIILADSRIIHRATPHKGDYFRTSLFSQISKLEPRTYRERLLINPAFIDDRVVKSKRIMNFLGFGINNSNNIFPPTDISHVPLNKNILKITLRWFLKRIFKNIFELLPLFLKKIIRKKIQQEVDYKSKAK
jgi:hypothetical protein